MAKPGVGPPSIRCRAVFLIAGADKGARHSSESAELQASASGRVPPGLDRREGTQMGPQWRIPESKSLEESVRFVLGVIRRALVLLIVCGVRDLCDPLGADCCGASSALERFAIPIPRTATRFLIVEFRRGRPLPN